MSHSFVHPEGVRFTCSRCGDCCRGWNVMLGPGERERLEALSWEGRAPELVGAAPASRVGNRLALARRADGACIYLGPENQCRIHESFGEAAKPLMCRLYPFGFLPVGDRIAVDVSFACRAVSEGSGAAIRTRTAEWSRLLQEPPAAAERHRFSKKHDVPGDLLWEIEHHLLDLLSDESLDLVDRTRAVLEFNRLATTSDPGTDSARTLRRVLASGIPKQVRERRVDPEFSRMDKTGRAVFFHLLFATLNPTPPELLALPPKARDREARLRVQAADAYRFPDARPLVDNRELGTTFGAIARVSARDLERGASAELAAVYLKAKILGQRFLREGEDEIPLVDAVPRLLLLYPMLVWTAKALAAERGADAVAERDARRALRLLDRSYGSIPLSMLPAKARKAWRFVLLETELPVAATLEMLAAL